MLQPVGELLCEVPIVLHERFAQTIKQSPPQVMALLTMVSGEMTRQELSQALGLKDRKHIKDTYLQPALDAGCLR